MITVLELGHYYPANKDSFKNKLSLEVAICKFCSTVQIPNRFSKEVNFPPEYPFRSGITKALRDNFLDLGEKIANQIPKGSKVLEIGSNDGTLLSMLKQKEFNVQGVEPTLAYLETNSEIEVIPSFFEDIDFTQTFDCVVLTNTFAHLSDQVSALKKIRTILSPNGLIFIEVVDLEQLLALNEFDKFTHEHGIYFDRQTLRSVMRSQGFSEVGFERINTHGGSFRATFKNTGEISPMEQSNVSQTILKFGILRKKIDEIKIELPRVLEELGGVGASLFLAGATTRGEIFVNALELDKSRFRAILENPRSKRIGSVMPNLQIEVINDENISEVDSPIVLILAWHVQDEVVKSLKLVNPSVKCVVALPEIRIV
jgi:SAM-dependent methyltransferase